MIDKNYVWYDKTKHKDLIINYLISGMINGYDDDYPIGWDNQYNPIYGFGYNPVVQIRHNDLQELMKEAVRFVNTKIYGKEGATNVE